MGLLTDFYNTVAKFFRPQEETGDEASKSVATNRLKLVLMQDRTNLTPKILEQMRGELVDLLSKYLEMDKELLELNFEQEGDQVALMLSIPVIRAKDEEEIEKALAEAEENKNDSSENTDDNSDENEDEEEEEETDSEVTEEETEEEIIDNSGIDSPEETEEEVKADSSEETDLTIQKTKTSKKKEEIPESTSV